MYRTECMWEAYVRLCRSHFEPYNSFSVVSLLNVDPITRLAMLYEFVIKFNELSTKISSGIDGNDSF